MKSLPLRLSSLFLSLSFSACLHLNGVADAAVSVSISPGSGSVVTDGTLQFKSNVSGTPDTAVLWSVSGGAVSSLGVFTAPAAAGTYTVTATSLADPTKSAN